MNQANLPEEPQREADRPDARRGPRRDIDCAPRPSPRDDDPRFGRGPVLEDPDRWSGRPLHPSRG